MQRVTVTVVSLEEEQFARLIPANMVGLSIGLSPAWAALVIFVRLVEETMCSYYDRRRRRILKLSPGGALTRNWDSKRTRASVEKITVFNFTIGERP